MFQNRLKTGTIKRKQLQKNRDVIGKLLGDAKFLAVPCNFKCSATISIHEKGTRSN